MSQLDDVTVNIIREGDGYVALCPELDIVSQGKVREEALSNLIEAVELFLRTADQSEIERRLDDYDARVLEEAKASTTSFRPLEEVHAEFKKSGRL